MSTQQYLPYTDIEVTLAGRSSHDTQVFKDLKLAKGIYRITFLDKDDEKRLSFWDGSSMNVMIYYDCDDYLDLVKRSIGEASFSESMLLKAIAAATNGDKVIKALS